ncbi:dTDP-4-dehydrorhamnose reductase [Polynucleobacter sp. MWH-UH2A]|uniref:dTDP-4-dehydrorhamnose reductase n=1 Tax=Polynucleobacter sp. MWH-UH2A TaxID=1855617 RepID=UPI001BFE46AD|nr:dTDP-4-dehydrorhamnose reductase [Polynucleobacter sp. MWH-UH2A]QWD64305.1 dTDP-4-dehydrorhamnose reductase [Polynucleobacter sp. MWH-UH2A]
MNILVFGKDGQLGKAFQEQFQNSLSGSENNLRFVGRSECDLSEPSQIVNLLNSFEPNLIINAAAYTSVDKAEIESDLAFAINASAPEIMAKYAVQHGSTLLHFSTDYVFDGLKQGAYTEIDSPNPLGIYGRSKEAGEKAILSTFAKSAVGQYAILRTGWVYGDGSNFIRTILRLAKDRSALRVIGDQYGVPTSAVWLAKVAMHLVLDETNQRKFNSGIYHAVPQGEANWYDLACLATQVAKDAGLSLQASPGSIAPIPASEYPLPAPRPMNSRLSRVKLQAELERLGLMSKLPHWYQQWDEQVSAYVKNLSRI